MNDYAQRDTMDELSVETTQRKPAQAPTRQRVVGFHNASTRRDLRAEPPQGSIHVDSVVSALPTSRHRETEEQMVSRAQSMAEMTAAFFNGARNEPELCDRVAFADTVVRIHFADPDDEVAVTVWLNQSPISAEVGVHGDVEIEIFASSNAWRRIISGKVELPIAILHGEVTYTGPVRKFLRVVPILETFDFSAFPGLGSRAQGPEAVGELVGARYAA